MSADNGIYILKCLDGYRITEAQAIENIYWYYYDDRMYDPSFHHELIETHGDIPKEYYSMHQKEELNPKMLMRYFGDSKVLQTEEEALKEAHRLAQESPILEYGVSFIRGWEDKPFPTE